MRRYCTRCGASLIKTEEPIETEPVEEPEEEPVVETPGFSEERHVLPSEVASKQVEIEHEAVGPPPSEAKEEVTESRDMEYDKGREVVRDILEKVKAAEARSRGEEVSTSSETEVEPLAEEAIEEEEVEEAEEVYEEEIEEIEEVEEEYEEYEEEIEEEEPALEKPAPPPPEVKKVEVPTPKATSTVSVTADDSMYDDRIRAFEADIKTSTIEREQLQAELGQLRTRLDEEVERYLVAAETKRTRAEGLERELKLAKNEYNDANKEYKNAEKRRKNELSNIEKRIRDVEKRIKKAEDGKEKRIRDLEKERQKREEEARK